MTKMDFLIFNIPANGNNTGKSLPNSNFYFNILNEEPFAFSNVDSWGCITDTYSFDGYFIQTEPNTFGVILGHEFSSFIYRGQNMDYPNFLPTANRYDLRNEDEQLKHCIDWAKKQEFLNLFKRTPCYERCEKFRYKHKLNKPYYPK